MLAVAAAIAGNTLEWFDFTVYGLFSIYIAGAFFPADSVLAFGLTRLLGAQAVYDWGWRIPFILGLSIAPIGLYLRARVPETPAYLAESRPSRTQGKAPIAVLWQAHRGALFKTFCLTVQL